MLSFSSRKRSPPCWSRDASFWRTVECPPARGARGGLGLVEVRSRAGQTAEEARRLGQQTTAGLGSRGRRHIAGGTSHLTGQAAVHVGGSGAALVVEDADAGLGRLLEHHVLGDLGLEDR